MKDKVKFSADQAFTCVHVVDTIEHSELKIKLYVL